jgi:HD-like signal output (HDOD) protein
MSPEANEFIELLQLELAQRELELPSYPNVAVQLQQLLADDNVSTDRVVRVVGAEPILAARVVRLASSAALNPRGTPVSDLRSAIARLGFNSLRAAATSFAVTQLRLADRYKEILEPLTELWNENVSMAATACVIARRCQRVSADTALFAGLVAGVGKICLLARGADSRYMMTHPDEFSQVVREWHAEVAHALLTSWSVAEDVIEAVHGHQTHRNNSRVGLALTDVLSVADVLSEHDITPELRVDMLQTQHAAQRLGLRVDDCIALMRDSEAELALLRSALAF